MTDIQGGKRKVRRIPGGSLLIETAPAVRIVLVPLIPVGIAVPLARVPRIVSPLGIGRAEKLRSP
jgi:hypothetical protein